MQKRKVAAKPLGLGLVLKKASAPLKTAPAPLKEPQGESTGNHTQKQIAPAKPPVFTADSDSEQSAGEEEAGRQHKKKRNLDLFLEELKHTQEQREHTKSFDAMQSTNLFISNVHPTTDEQQLKQAFMQFGDIDSIKIMWPRTPEEHERGRNNAFVCFSLRAHAGLALEAMDGQVLDGNKLCVRWGKPVSKLVAGAAKAAKESAGEEPENPFNAVQDEVTVHRPKDPAVLRTIHWTIQHVLQYGTPFEVMLISRGDSRLAFLTNSRSAEGVYYRWRMYSLLNGDTKERWRTKMFVMYDQGGPVWQPPPIVRDVLGLSRIEREQLVDALNHVTNERGSVAHAMKLAIECASAWEDVVDVVTRSLLDDAAPYMSKYARLLVVSDILHNCSEQGAWRLRQGFEKVLDRVFRHLADVYRAIEARLRAEHFRKLVLAVLAVWEVRMVFPPDMLHAFSKGFL